MKYSFQVFLFTMSGIFFSCTSSKSNLELLEGEWRNVTLRLELSSVNGQDNDSVLEVSEGQWENILEIKPIRTVFTDNGAYVSRYYNLKDSLLFEAEGNWFFVEDSLYMTNDEGTTAYHFQPLDSNRARFISRLDWDDDGMQDDLYNGVQQKQFE